MGGKETARGIILQTIWCVLDLFNEDNNWINVVIEPNIDAEKVDILWEYNDNKKKVVQVKSKQNTISYSNAKKWSSQLENDYEADSYELILIGPCSINVTKMQYIGNVALQKKNLGIDDLIKNSAFSLAAYLENKGKQPLRTEIYKTVIESLIAVFEKFSTKGKPISRDEFEQLLLEKINLFLPENLDEEIADNTEELFHKLYTILFKTEDPDINRTELIILIESEIGFDKIAKILKLEYTKTYTENSGKVLSLFNENYRINIQSGLEAGHKLDALNISTPEKKYFHYGRENQDNTIRESFRKFFFDKCLESDIMVDEKYYLNEMGKIFRDHNERKQQKKRYVFDDF